MDDARRTSLKGIKRYRACQEGSWERVRSLVAGGDGVSRMHLVMIIEVVPSSPAILVDCGVLFTPGSVRLAIPVSQSHALVLPLCYCDARIACGI